MPNLSLTGLEIETCENSTESPEVYVKLMDFKQFSKKEMKLCVTEPSKF
jgi:hypothetical protein